MRIVISIIISLLALTAMSQVTHIEDRGIEPGENKPVPQGYDGIDVSKYQGDIDWAAIAKNKHIKFAYIKATEGATYVDPRFEENIANARKHGVKVGCYHFLRSSSTIADQFENIKRYIRRDEQDLVPMIDVETKGKWTDEQLVDSLHTLAVMVYEHYHCAPMIYTYVNFYNKYLSGMFTNYPLFIARYTDDEPVLADGTRYVLWQYSERGSVNGIGGNVDMSRFGSKYGLKDISIRSQHIITVNGKELKPEDLVMRGVDVQDIAPKQYNTMDEKELLKLKREAAEQERKLRQEQAKEAKKQAEAEAKARAAEAAKNAKKGVTAQSAEDAEKAQDGATTIATKAEHGTANKNNSIQFSTRKRKTPQEQK